MPIYSPQMSRRCWAPRRPRLGPRETGSRHGTSRIARLGMWTLQAEETEPADPDAPVRAILSRLTHDESVWAEIGSRYDLSLFCGWFMKNGNEGVTIAPDTYVGPRYTRTHRGRSVRPLLGLARRLHSPGFQVQPCAQIRVPATVRLVGYYEHLRSAVSEKHNYGLRRRHSREAVHRLGRSQLVRRRTRPRPALAQPTSVLNGQIHRPPPHDVLTALEVHWCRATVRPIREVRVGAASGHQAEKPGCQYGRTRVQG